MFCGVAIDEIDAGDPLPQRGRLFQQPGHVGGVGGDLLMVAGFSPLAGVEVHIQQLLGTRQPEETVSDREPVVKEPERAVLVERDQPE